MKPLIDLLIPTASTPTNTHFPPAVESVEIGLQPWFWRNLSRDQAEKLLLNRGDFLVRTSLRNPTNFILSARGDHGHTHMHLLDENNKVRLVGRVIPIEI